MTLDDFIKSMQEDLERFRKFNTQGRKTEPEHFPEKQEEGEWYEQFVTFEEMERNHDS